MWFKQIQLYQLGKDFKLNHDEIISKLEALAFTPCLPSMPQSTGWISPIDEDNNMPLLRSINGYIIICLKVEEKILPAAVLRHELAETIKQVETAQERKLSQKEKLSLKDEIFMTLLPRAFSRYTKVYAYLDTKNQRLVLGTANAKKAESFLSMFRKTFNEDVQPAELKKLSYLLTHWLKNQNYPTSFNLENACVLQDPQHESRIIRCKDQDLRVHGIQAFIKDGFEAIQLALSWNDCLNFVLNDKFEFSAISFADEIKEQLAEVQAETKLQQFDGDFLIMTETFSKLFDELIPLLSASNVVPMAKQA